MCIQCYCRINLEATCHNCNEIVISVSTGCMSDQFGHCQDICQGTFSINPGILHFTILMFFLYEKEIEFHIIVGMIWNSVHAAKSPL